MRYIVFDLEATCWQQNEVPVGMQMETIEIGAVELTGQDLVPGREFSSFVRPVLNPILSEFCTGLTSITQAQVDKADSFALVFPQFREWVGDRSFRLCSWGKYDVHQLAADCRRHGLRMPARFPRKHINLKRLFADQVGWRPCGMKAALKKLDIPLVGTHHRGIDDARNIANIARRILI